MPIYLSLPGHESKEPWRHGLSVYERPVPLEYTAAEITNHHGNDNDVAPNNNYSNSSNAGNNNNVHRSQMMMRNDTTTSSHSSLMDQRQSSSSSTTHPANTTNNSNDNKSAATPIRRIRHGEVVLVDQCVIAHGRYWLRLKWPGEHTGHGGYVALSKLDDDEDEDNDNERRNNHGSSPTGNNNSNDSSSNTTTNNERALQVMGSTASTIRSTPFLSPETNVCFPTSDSMKLLPMYDDGLNHRNNNNNNNRGGGDEIIIPLDSSGDPVFCRICREGLHDVNSDYLETTTPSSSSQQQQQQSSSMRGMNNNNNNGGGEEEVDEGSRERDVGATSAAAATITTTSRNDTEEGSNNDTEERSSSLSSINNNNSITIPPITRTHPSIDNPLLAPCKCTGSMAFVHYLCVEQWRNRSRHPGAHNGLNCETCGAEYTLPPPPSRPTTNNNRMGIGMEGVVVGDDDWLDAMPPHVLAALRRPHLWWQIGAAVVRRRWLRPIVPTLISPLVALYCKARRTLKKRGVSRRRWACSLCRRRARWKCVRCLRSYYCSRQCQNVSWHIVHKHVCYKPERFWSSVVVYALGILVFVPGIITVSFWLVDLLIVYVILVDVCLL